MRLSNKKIILLLHILALVLYRLLGYSGHFGFDDMEYAEIAFQLTQGEMDFENHFFYRFTLIIPTALSYFLFGVNDVSSSIPPIIASIFILILIYKFCKPYSTTILSLALSMTLFSEWFLFYSNKIMVDVYVCLGVTAVLYSIYKARFSSGVVNNNKYPILFSLSLLFAFMSKGTVILTFPLLAFLFIHDVINKKHIRFWLGSIVFTVILFALYFLSLYALTDSFSSRFDAIEENGYVNRCSYILQSTEVVLKRIYRDFFVMLRNEGPAWSLIFVMSALFFSKTYRFFNLKTPLSFFLVSSFFLFLASNFMSISFSGYNPMCIDIRHYLWLIPVSAVATAILIEKTRNNKKFRLLTLSFLVILCISSFRANKEILWTLYLPVSALYGVYCYYKSEVFRAKLFPVLFTLCFLIQPVRISLNARESNYVGQMDYVKEQVIDQENNATIITDNAQARIGTYLSNYDTNKVKFISFAKAEKSFSSENKKLILINPYTQFFSGTDNTSIPFSIQNIIETSDPIEHDENLNISIFQAEKLIDPKSRGKKIASSLFDFEDTLANWSYSTASISNERSKSKQHSEKVWEYSATFRLPVDSIQLNAESKNIFIESSLYSFVKKSTEAAIVISVTKGPENIFWKSYPIDSFQKAYSIWWNVNIFSIIKKEALQPGSTITIYLWNKEKTEVWIDDFEVNIYEY